MGFGKSLKKAFVRPIKAVDNKVIPVVNKINSYLDVWFPQEKYNWRKIAIGWAIVQAIVITALEIYITIQNKHKIDEVYKFHKTSNDINKLSQLSVTDSLAVYHMIFIVAQFFQLYLICDTITKSSTLQLIPGTIFSLGVGIYSVVQYIQANRGIKNSTLVQEMLQQPEKINDLRRGKWAEILIIVLMSIFCFGWIVITLRLYKNFGWNVFKQLGADIGVKNRLKLYQILLALLKIDIFFFSAFTIQFAIFVITNIKDGIAIKIVNIILLGLNFIMPFIGFIATKKENYVYMTLFIVLLSMSLGYMVFNFFDILIDVQSKKDENCEKGTCERKTYRDCSVSLSMACISSIIVGIITFVLALINFKNFPKGLKEDKTKRPSNSQHSTMSKSYNNTPKRFSIE
jgi:F0F1-type ATP synthase assembly protein I